MELNELRKIAEAATPGPRMVLPSQQTRGAWAIPGVASTVMSKHADAEFIAAFDPLQVLALITRTEQAEQQRDSAREACKTLAEVLANHSEWIVEATDSQDLIGEDGDGDWDVVWDRVMELGDQKRKAEQLVQRVREVASGWATLDRPFREAILRALDGDGRG